MLLNQCEEYLGMGMIFSLVDAAQEWINENVSSEVPDEPSDNQVTFIHALTCMFLYKSTFIYLHK
jgi:hypothetical protein